MIGCENVFTFVSKKRGGKEQTLHFPVFAEKAFKFH